MSGYYKSSAEPLCMKSFTSISSNPLPPARSTLFFPTDTSRPNLPPAVANVPPDHIRGYLHHKKVNHYLVGSTLGEGSFAKVKEAFHVLVGEKVAMKVIDKKKAQQDPYVAKNFRREAKLLQMVRHPNILQLLEVIETDSSFYLITELCSGGELMKYIYKKGKLDEKETRKYMRHIVSAVDHLHKAGIIHRDLKVENLLLDANMDIKLIDFGLSNEEFVQSENGMTRCSTQCGSPAYAAPELLGQKKYGPQIDIWSIGVNMYAMLTGCLPYTVEPFNITALHAKMLENRMNPIPDHLSNNCKDLLENLLKSNPEDRMNMANIMKHPWMNECHVLPFEPVPFPNKLQLLDLNHDIVQHIVHILKVKESEDRVRQELVSNRATQAGAVYHLLLARLARYKKLNASNVRHRTSRLSRGQGDDDDIQSVKSMPTRTSGHVPARSIRRETLPKDCPISHPPIEAEVEEEDNIRRKNSSSMPEMMLKDNLEQLREMSRKEETKKEKRKTVVSHPSHSGNTDRHGTNTTTAGGTHKTSTQTDTCRPTGVKLPRSNLSTPARLNHLRQSTYPSNHIKTHNVIEAWCANPASSNTSRQPLQHGPRQSSGMARNLSSGIIRTRADCRGVTRAASFGEHSRAASFGKHSRAASFGEHSRAASFDEHSRAASFGEHSRAASFGDHVREDSQTDDLTFHEVGLHTFPRSSKKKSKMFVVGPPSECSNTFPVLPSINHSQDGRRVEKTHTTISQRGTHSKRSKNGYHSQSVTEYKAETEQDIDKMVKEIQKVVHSWKMRDAERKGLWSVLCTWNGVKIQISVSKELGMCKLSFQWISGGDLTSYNNKREKITKMVKL